MTDIRSILALPVTDEEIAAAAVSLGLPPRAFHGQCGHDPRLEVLRANRTIDVAACPGSGKTTLLVAKLAILAKRWTAASSGICVLSHTNVARLEIENRLGADPAARAVLSYPHFVGTIHGFINQFVALPWLRSQGIEAVAIDNEICLRRRWFKLSRAHRTAVEQTNRDADLLRIVDADHGLGDIRWAKGVLDKQKAMYRAFVAACRETTREGYFCHEDMMIWAGQALDQHPALRDAVRNRFPILFLDEVQDNSEHQELILHRLFVDGEVPVIRQRFGDMNQAIYGRASDTRGASSDPFPDAAVEIPVANSHRFGSQIARLADPLALVPPGLIGLRDHPVADHGKQAAILLFDANRPEAVLPAFGDMLIARFSADERAAGTFAAVGAIHRDTGRENIPNCVAHYWSGYDHQLARVDARPEALISYLRHGVAEAGATGDLRPIVEKAADGLLRLSNLLNPSVRHPIFANRHRQCLLLLDHDPVTAKRYQALCWKLASGELAASAMAWRTWKRPVLDIATALLGGAQAGDPGAFLDWEDERLVEGIAPKLGNVFAHPVAAPAVRIKVGSIHSVKGETHLATLVLDTWYKGSHLDRIKHWLTGAEAGVPHHVKKPELRRSLKQHYVAVTRPSHLLCLAMRNDALTEAELELMRARDWCIGQIGADEVVWRD